MLPWILGGRLYPQYVWILSGSNPSDPLSRGRTLRLWIQQMQANMRGWKGHLHGWIRDLCQDGDVEPHPGPALLDGILFLVSVLVLVLVLVLFLLLLFAYCLQCFC